MNFEDFMSKKKRRIFQNILKILSRLPSQQIFCGNSLFFWWKISTFLTIMEAAKVLEADNII
jgi:hypothetical protein